MTLTITIDERSEQSLEQMSRINGIEPPDMASRLLRRAIRAAQPKPVYDIDIEALKSAYEEFAAEDIALAEATAVDHVELLAYEDRA